MRLIPFTATLKDGAHVLVREVTQDDRHLLQIGFAGLSDQAKYFRFLMPHKHLTFSELDQFTASNSRDHFAVGALLEGPLAPEPVGIARYVRLPDQDHVAEIAITIADRYQHQGLGRLLVGVLGRFARRDGITEFAALVHRDNRRMLGLFAQLGGTQVSIGGADIEVRCPVGIDSDHPPSLPEAPETAVKPTQDEPRQRSAEIRRVSLCRQHLSVLLAQDQPASVWENEGGAIVPTVRRVSVNV